MSKNKIHDITQAERRILSHLRAYPAMFLGDASLRNFCHFVGGYTLAMQTLGKDKDHIMIPDGLNEYTSGYYKDSSSRNCFSIILENEPDNEKALNVFFKILDAYLDIVGYEAVPVWKE